MSVVQTASAAKEAAQQQRLWSTAANAAKRNIVIWRAITLLLLVGGAVLATLATQVAHISSGLGQVLGVCGGIAVGAVPVVRAARLSKERTRDWIRLRSVSEGIKSELYGYLARVPPYADSAGDERLRVVTNEIADTAQDLRGRLLGLAVPLRPLPEVSDVASYVTHRIDQQISGYYEPKAAEAKQRLAYADRLVFALGLAAVAFGVLATRGGIGGVAAWVPVITTVTGAVVAHAAAAHYADDLLAFSRTASQLRHLKDEWARERRLPGRASLADEELVRKGEAVISIENKGWMAKLSVD